MILNNVILYAKNWYKRRPNAIWMDLAHCIYHDHLIQCFTKSDVCRWVMNQFDNHYNDFKKIDNSYSVGYVLEHITKKLDFDRQFKDATLTMEDAIIDTYLGLVSIAPKDIFEETYKPADFVLPLNYENAWVNTFGKRKWHPAEMKCDVIGRIIRTFDDAKEQRPLEYSNYHTIEAQLMGKSFDDVQPLVDDDAGCDEIIITGDVLNSKFDSYMHNDLFVDMGIYDRIKPVENHVKFKVKLKRLTCLYWDRYEVRSIKKYLGK